MTDKEKQDYGALLVIFNLIIAIGIGLIVFGILSAIFDIHIWVISISIGIMLLSFAFIFIIEKFLNLKF